MPGITIADCQDGILTVDLATILHLLGSQVENSEWIVFDLECRGAAADRLHQVADTETRISGQTLLQLAGHLTQVIDGVFEGYQQGESSPWAIVQAIDSSAYEVESNDRAALLRLKQHFKAVRDWTNREPMKPISLVS